MGKTTDLFKKIRDTKGTFHAKMGSIKDRNGMDLTEAEGMKNMEIIDQSGKKKWPNQTQMEKQRHRVKETQSVHPLGHFRCS